VGSCAQDRAIAATVRTSSMFSGAGAASVLIQRAPRNPFGTQPLQTESKHSGEDCVRLVTAAQALPAGFAAGWDSIAVRIIGLRPNA
jgi:hypothetical protein